MVKKLVEYPDKQHPAIYLENKIELRAVRLRAQGSCLKKDNSYFHTSLCADRRMRVSHKPDEDIRQRNGDAGNGS